MYFILYTSESSITGFGADSFLVESSDTEPRYYGHWKLGITPEHIDYRELIVWESSYRPFCTIWNRVFVEHYEKSYIRKTYHSMLTLIEEPPLEKEILCAWYRSFATCHENHLQFANQLLCYTSDFHTTNNWAEP